MYRWIPDASADFALGPNNFDKSASHHTIGKAALSPAGSVWTAACGDGRSPRLAGLGTPTDCNGRELPDT